MCNLGDFIVTLYKTEKLLTHKEEFQNFLSALKLLDDVFLLYVERERLCPWWSESLWTVQGSVVTFGIHLQTVGVSLLTDPCCLTHVVWAVPAHGLVYICCEEGWGREWASSSVIDGSTTDLSFSFIHGECVNIILL